MFYFGLNLEFILWFWIYFALISTLRLDLLVYDIYTDSAKIATTRKVVNEILAMRYLWFIVLF